MKIVIPSNTFEEATNIALIIAIIAFAPLAAILFVIRLIGSLLGRFIEVR